jgi:hypothetical protein
MKRASLIAAAITLGLAQAASAQDVVGDAAVQNQWFTGTLEAPSPALPAAGILEVEPYVIWTRSHGAYDDGGSFHSSPNIDVLTSVTALKYSLTNRISIQALPSISHVSTSPGHYTGFGDLPVEAEYRLSDANNRTGLPSVTIAIGVTLPTGKYDRMRTALSGFGSGAYSLKQQILLQSLFDTRGGHPMRFRAYVAVYEPIGKSSVTDISTYGTSEGFHGEAQPFFCDVGRGRRLCVRPALGVRDGSRPQVRGWIYFGRQICGECSYSFPQWKTHNYVARSCTRIQYFGQCRHYCGSRLFRGGPQQRRLFRTTNRYQCWPLN